MYISTGSWWCVSDGVCRNIQVSQLSVIVLLLWPMVNFPAVAMCHLLARCPMSQSGLLMELRTLPVIEGARCHPSLTTAMRGMIDRRQFIRALLLSQAQLTSTAVLCHHLSDEHSHNIPLKFKSTTTCHLSHCCNLFSLLYFLFGLILLLLYKSYT